MKFDTTMIVLTAALVLPTGYLFAGPLAPGQMPAGEVPDNVITAQVQAAFSKEPELEQAGLSVKTYRGTVRLSGSVATDDELARAEDLASRVEGVQEVHSHLHVKSTGIQSATTEALARL